MSLMEPVTRAVEQAADEAWIQDLTDPGPPGHAAQQRLHDLLVRAARHQVWRLRHQLPGAGVLDLEDLAQQAANDAMVAVLARLDSFEGRSRFSTWAYKFAILHAGVAVRRQAWRHREVPLWDGFEWSAGAAAPDSVVQANDLRCAVEAAIATALTPRQRQVALALLLDQVPIDVLADRLDTNRNALYKTLHDARQRIRATLQASGHLDPNPRGRTS